MGGRSRQSLSSGIVDALADVAKVLDAHEHRAAVIGGMAVIARGVQRLTRDIDIAIAGADLSCAELAEELQRHGMAPRISDAVAFAEESQVLLMRHEASGVDIDVSRAWLPFEIEALAAAGYETFGGVHIAIAQPEDLIIFKAVAWRPQDQQDVERLLALYGDRVDLERIRRHVRARRGDRRRSPERVRFVARSPAKVLRDDKVVSCNEIEDAMKKTSNCVEALERLDSDCISRDVARSSHGSAVR